MSIEEKNGEIEITLNIVFMWFSTLTYWRTHLVLLKDGGVGVGVLKRS
jgi:hypothetical protein